MKGFTRRPVLVAVGIGPRWGESHLPAVRVLTEFHYRRSKVKG